MCSEYTITIRADSMPSPQDIALYLQAEVIGINKVKDNYVTANELVEITGYSKSTILSKCRHLNVGSVGKSLYNKDDAIRVLSAKPRAGRKRVN